MFHEGEKQNLSKTLVRYELFCAFQVGILQQFLVLISLGKFTDKRFVLRKKHKEHNIIRLTINKKRWNLSPVPGFGSSSFISKRIPLAADGEKC